MLHTFLEIMVCSALLVFDRIFNFARQVTGSADDAGDVAQESFVKAWKALPDLRDNNIFGSWLHRIALNLAKDALTKRGRTHTLSLDEPVANSDGGDIPREIESGDPNPEESLMARETQTAVQRAVDSLSTDHRLVVTMHHMEEMDVESIAKTLGISKGTVMSRLSRARGVLRRKLAPYVERN